MWSKVEFRGYTILYTCSIKKRGEQDSDTCIKQDLLAALGGFLIYTRTSLFRFSLHIHP